MLVFDLVPDFRRYALYERGMNENSFRHIKHILSRLSAFSDNADLKTFNTHVIREFLYTQKETHHWSPKTFRNNRQSLCSFFSWCESMQYIKKNPVKSIEKPKVPNSLPRFLTREQIKLLSKAYTDYPWKTNLQAIRNRSIFMTFLYSGLRLNELLNLRKSNVDFDEKHFLILNGKGQKDRIVPIHSTLLPVLENYQKIRSRSLEPSIWFFTGLYSSSRMYPKDIYRFFKQITIKCGVKTSPHELRHSFARMACENNFNLFKLQQVMGHTNLSTTQIYLSASTKNIQESLDELRI